MNIPAPLQIVLDALIAAGGRPMLVGGCVRDFLMGFNPKDFDIEVFGLTPSDVAKSVAKLGAVNSVGQAFGIIKLRINEMEYDISVPRRENKIGVGHKDYQVYCDKDMTPKDAAARRDFTINSMYYDVINSQIVDEYGGQEAIKNGILDPTSLAFIEDSLRILRGMQFASRFGMEPSSKCIVYSSNMHYEYKHLPKERIWGEWEKWAKGQYPSAGIILLKRCGWLDLYPEIYNLLGCPQDPDWHPEGSAFTHTMHVCDEMAAICERDNIVGDERIVMMFAALCHDFGKATTTELIDGRWRSHGHCEAGVDLTDSFLQNIGAPHWVAEKVKPLVAEHLTHVREKHTPRGVRRLTIRLHPANIQELLWLIEADMGGRPPLAKGLPTQAVELKEMADKCKVQFNMPQAIVMGRHLIQLGFKPGVNMGKLLKVLYEAQLDGEFDTVEEAIAKLPYYQALLA